MFAQLLQIRGRGRYHSCRSANPENSNTFQLPVNTEGVLTDRAVDLGNRRGLGSPRQGGQNLRRSRHGGLRRPVGVFWRRVLPAFWPSVGSAAP